MRWGCWACVVVVLGLAGCLLETRLVPCGDRLCPAGMTCVAQELCASTDQVAACAGIADGDTCSAGGGVGRCDRGVCVATGCGNGVVDLDENCDDGNQLSGDGCRADCRKIEMCGDAIADDNEGCDDGNSNAADGCDTCVPTTWRAEAIVGGNLSATSVVLLAPNGIAADRHDNVYIADTSGGRIWRVDASGVITVVAGTGTLGLSGDGGAATSAQLAGPTGIAIDGLGNVYFVETTGHVVRRVDPKGVISTVAGTGTFGFTGDNGPATSARLNTPIGVAVDGLGNLYITDSLNQRIRRVDLFGVITTVVGSGVRSFSGDGGPAINAALNVPNGVVVDDIGNLYFSDQQNHRIRRVNSSGVITTVAGNGQSGSTGDGGLATSAQIGSPGFITLDGAGNLVFAQNFRVRRVETGVITTLAGTGFANYNGDGGPATSAAVAAAGVALDSAGNLYVSDGGNHRLRRVDTVGIITTVAGTGHDIDGNGGLATSAQLDNPTGIAIDGAGNVYIADSFHHCVRRVDTSGVISTVAGTGTSGYGGDGGKATDALLKYPEALAIDVLGNLYIADSYNFRIRRVDPAGIITTVAGGATGGFGGDGGPATSASLNVPSDVAVDSAGNIYIADTYNYRVRRVAPNGIISTFAGTGTPGFAGDNAAATAAQLTYVYGVDVDATGLVYIADTDNYRIRRVALNGIITTVAGSGAYGAAGDNGPATSAELSSVYDVAVDNAGNLYISDTENDRVRRVDSTGTITTVMGTTAGLDGDGGSSTGAQISDPWGVAVDGAGAYYIADTANRRVRHIANGVITSIAGRIDPEAMGPLAQARFADPRAFAVSSDFTFVAGGSHGVVLAVRKATQWVEVVAGRYPQPSAIGTRARFRGEDFGDVSGVAFDEAARLIYFTESNRVHVVTMMDPGDSRTWTIAPLVNVAGTAGFADGAASSARFRSPTGLYLDSAAKQLYVADTGNHVVRAIDLSLGVASATVRTVAGTPETRGLFGDGSAATAALLFAPQAVTRCANGDLFVADTGNHRVRRVAAQGAVITTVLGVGVAASSGEGSPASSFPVNTPLGIACDAVGNLFVTSSTTVRLVPADASGAVDGTGSVQTIYGAPPRESFPASVTSCLTGLVSIDATTVHVADSCTGLLIALHREAAP